MAGSLIGADRTGLGAGMPGGARTLVVVGCAGALCSGVLVVRLSQQSSIPSSISTVSTPETTQTVPPSATSTSTSTSHRAATGVEGLAALVDDLIQRREFSGVVLIANGDTVIWEPPVGWQTATWTSRTNVDTRFNLGSMNKMFTAVAILAADGRAAADPGRQTIADYLPTTRTWGLRSRFTVGAAA